MKWLIVHPGPEFSVHDVFEGWREALAGLGEQVAVYNTNDRLCFYDQAHVTTGHVDDEGHVEFRKALTREQVTDLATQGILAAVMAGWPDVVMFVSGFFIPWQIPALLRARGRTVLFLCTEAPYEDKRQVELAAHADVTLLNDPVTIGKYREVCANVAYAPHAYRPSVHYPRDNRKRYDLAFSGTGYESRIAFFEGMGLRGLKVGLAGNWVQLEDTSPLRRYLLHDKKHCLENEQTADLYAKARAGINFYRRDASDGDTAEGWAVGPREIEMAACGLWFLRDPRGEGDDLFPHLPTFGDPQTAGELLRWGLKNDAVREQGVERSLAAVEDRTFDASARKLLRLLDRQPVSI